MKKIIGRELKIDRIKKGYTMKITGISEICEDVYYVSGISKNGTAPKKISLTCLTYEILDNLV